MKLHDNTIESQKSKQVRRETSPDHMQEDSERRKAFEYIKQNPGADSNEVQDKTGAPKSALSIMTKKKLLERKMDRSIARYRYYIHEKWREEE